METRPKHAKQNQQWRTSSHIGCPSNQWQDKCGGPTYQMVQLYQPSSWFGLQEDQDGSGHCPSIRSFHHYLQQWWVIWMEMQKERTYLPPRAWYTSPSVGSLICSNLWCRTWMRKAGNTKCSNILGRCLQGHCNAHRNGISIPLHGQGNTKNA